MRPWILIGFVCACFLAGACRALGDRYPARPEGTWRLVELPGIDVAQLSRAPELVIGADGTLSGFAGVNRFSGRTDAEALAEGRIAAGPMTATRMAGPPEAMSVEARFLALFDAVLEWRRIGQALELVRNGEVRARFVAPEADRGGGS